MTLQTKFNNSNQNGFTLVELMLSMAFVSILLVTIAMTIIQMATTYNRGITLKEVNQAARDISDDIERSVQSSALFTINEDGSDSINLVQSKTSVNDNTVVVSGRLCLGKYTYIWNTASAIEKSYAKRARYLTSTGAVGDDVSFIKVPDTNKKYCAKDSDGELLNQNVLYADAKNATELLKQGDRTLRMLDFAVTSSDSTFDALSSQRLYTISYTIGAGKLSAMEFENGIPVSCLAPDDPDSDLMYCNVQQFKFTLRAGNTVN